MSEVETNVWMRGRAASRTASQARSTSAGLARASPATTGPSTSRAMAWTASKSPGDAIGKPASMTSTPSRASWWAISSFSAVLRQIPGDCSPSRRVVSKMRTRSGSGGVVMRVLLLSGSSSAFVLVRGFRRPPRAGRSP